METIGMDVLPGPTTDVVASVTDTEALKACLEPGTVVFHTAALHKPSVATHSKTAFVSTNVQGTLNILEASAAANARGVVFTSTTSAFGMALRPDADVPAVWIDERWVLRA